MLTPYALTAGAPPARGAVLRRVHQAAAVHDRHRVPARRLPGGRLQQVRDWSSGFWAG